MPALGPFRALRYDPAVAGDLSALICPPYDVISAEHRERLLARSPYNAVRVELPTEPGSGAPGERRAQRDDDYATAATTLRAWRDQGVLRIDERPALYVYEEVFRLANDADRVQRGFFARLRLEPLGEGVRPHERTMSGPKEDRLRLLRATATNTSPIVMIPGARDGRLGSVLTRVVDRSPDAQATDDAGVRHRLWRLEGDQVEAAHLTAIAGEEPLTIADGHHRYETALRYREELGSGSDGAGPRGRRVQADHVLVLVMDPGISGAGGPLILPTHRVVHGRPSAGAELVAAARAIGILSPAARDEIVRAFSPPFPAPPGRLGLVEPDGAYWLVPRARGEAPEGDPRPAVLRKLDVSIAEGVLAYARISVTYVHDAADAARSVAVGEAAAAILVAPTPLEAVLAVAEAGAVMPQKSTYFYPKVATGLAMHPLE